MLRRAMKALDEAMDDMEVAATQRQQQGHRQASQQRTHDGVGVASSSSSGVAPSRGSKRRRSSQRHATAQSHADVTTQGY